MEEKKAKELSQILLKNYFKIDAREEGDYINLYTQKTGYSHFEHQLAIPKEQINKKLLYRFLEYKNKNKKANATLFIIACMKKLFLSIILCLTSLLTFAQEIEYDKSANGERSIMCKYESVRSMKDKTVFSVALSAEQNKENITSYFLSLKTTSGTPITVPEGGKLLIKLKDDSVIELKTLMEYAGTVREVHNVNGFVFHDYTIFPAFPINDTQIEKISGGVKKIRLETVDGNRDKEFKKDKIGTVIEAQYELIQTKFKETTKTDNF